MLSLIYKGRHDWLNHITLAFLFVICFIFVVFL